MRALVKPFLDICLLRLAPQDLPASQLLLGVTLAGYLVFGTLLAAVYYPFGTSLMAGVTETALVCLMVAAALYVHKVPERLAQTLTAMMGTGAILNAVAVPLTAGLLAARAHGDDTASMELLSFALLIWSWAITAHILRNALSVRFGTGMALAVVFFILTLAVMRILFPDPGLEHGLEDPH